MALIMAIDPGNKESAFVLMDDITLRPIRSAKVPNGDVLAQIKAFRKAITKPVVVIENVASYGMAVGRDVFETCVWIGRFCQMAILCGLVVEYIYRRDVKLNLCMNSRAKDGNIRRALIDRFALHDMKNGKGSKKRPDWFYGFAADQWQAYAAGVTFIDLREGENEKADTMQ